MISSLRLALAKFSTKKPPHDRFLAIFVANLLGNGVFTYRHFLMAAAHEAPPLWQSANFRGPKPRALNQNHHTKHESH